MWLHQPIAAMPYIVLTFGLFFGWYFASSRMILSLLVLALADRALVQFPTAGAGQEAINQTILAMTAFLVPLNLLAFSILKEDSLSPLHGVTRVVFVLVQPFLLLWLSLPDQHDLAASFTREYIPSLYTKWTTIPQPALFAFAIALLLHLIRFVLHRDPLEGGAIWALLAVFLAYHASPYGWQPTNCSHGSRIDSLRHDVSILLSADLPRRYSPAFPVVWPMTKRSDNSGKDFPSPLSASTSCPSTPIPTGNLSVNRS